MCPLRGKKKKKKRKKIRSLAIPLWAIFTAVRISFLRWNDIVTSRSFHMHYKKKSVFFFGLSAVLLSPNSEENRGFTVNVTNYKRIKYMLTLRLKSYLRFQSRLPLQICTWSPIIIGNRCFPSDKSFFFFYIIIQLVLKVQLCDFFLVTL